MPSIDLAPVAPDIGIQAEPESVWQDPAQQQPPPEQFSDIMGRALTQASQDDSQDSNAASPAPRDKEKPRPASQSDSTGSTQGVCAEAAAAQAPPADVPVAGNAKPASDKGPVDGGPASATRQPGPGSTLAILSSSVDPGTRAGGGAAAAQTDLSGVNPAKIAVTDPKAGVPANGSDAGAKIAGLEDFDAVKATPVAKADLSDAAPDSGKNAAETDKTAGSPPVTVPGIEVTGISSAQQQVPMQKADKTNEIAASAEQKLPGPTAGVTGEDLPGKALRAVHSASREEKTESDSAASSSSADAASPTGASSAASAAAQWPSSTPLRSLERAHDLMSLHAFRLRDSGTDSLQVVIKPGPGTQLSLNLQMRDGNVEMSATLHQGDFNFLKSHWSELQQQLEARGIRLAPLATGEQAGAGDKNSFSQSGRSNDGGSGSGSQPPAFAAFTLPNTLTPATSTKTRTLRGWESWA